MLKISNLKKKLGWKQGNGEVGKTIECCTSCSENLKFEVKCEFEEFCYVAEICHEILQNIAELKIMTRQEKNIGKFYVKKKKKYFWRKLVYRDDDEEVNINLLVVYI